MAQTSQLFDRIVRFSVRPAAPNASTSVDADELIVLVPPAAVGERISATLAHGQVEARRHLNDGRRVRLVAHGATIQSLWPDWFADAPELTLTELGAYRHGNPVDETRELAHELHGWLNDMFRGAVEGLPGKLFAGSCAARFLQPLFEAVPYVTGLAQAHGSSDILPVRRDWMGLPLLQQRLSAGGGNLMGMPPEPDRHWPARIFAHIMVGFARAAGGQLRNYWRSRASRRELRRLRLRSQVEIPAVWLALVPDWGRINQHVIKAVALPALERSEPIGLLLCTTLLPGERHDATLSDRRGDKLWPGVAEVCRGREAIAIDQIVAVEKLPSLFAMLLVGAARSLRIAVRLARRPPLTDAPNLAIDLSRNPRALAALATTDVLQAMAASQAVQAAARRWPLQGRPVIFASLGLAETEAANLRLQEEGAITVDFVHGAGGDGWCGMTENGASLRAVWTKADAATCNLSGMPAIVVPPPIARPIRRELGRVPRRILLISNYTHEDTRGAKLPLEPFQLEMLRVVPLLRNSDAAPLQFRWRPHPSDDRDAIARARSTVEGLELSPNRHAEQDLEWADIVISSVSSMIPQILMVGLPLFVHVPPALEDLHDVQAISLKRRFFYAEDLVEPFRLLIDAIEAGAADAFAPERQASARFFATGDDVLKVLRSHLPDHKFQVADGTVPARHF